MRFPEKLFNLVSDCTSGALQWSESGDSILVEYQKLQKEILNVKENFKSDKVDSFIRQLNLYGFRKCNRYGDEKNEFKHILFLRGRRDLIDQIKRRPGYNPLKVRSHRRRNNHHNASRTSSCSTAPATECPVATPTLQNQNSNEVLDYWMNQYYLKYPRMMFPRRDLTQGYNSFVPGLNEPLDLESYAAKKGFVSPSQEANLKPKASSGSGVSNVQQQALAIHERKKTILVARPPNRSISVKIGNAAFVNTSTTPNNKKEEVILTENEPVLKRSGHIYLQQQEPNPATESGSVKKESAELQVHANAGSRQGKGPIEGDQIRTNEAEPWNDFFTYGNPNMCYMLLAAPNPGLFPGLYPGSHMPVPYPMSPGMFPNGGGDMAGCYPGYLG